MREQDLTLPDGRTLRVRQAGNPERLTVWWHHGSPNVGVPPGATAGRVSSPRDRLGQS